MANPIPPSSGPRAGTTPIQGKKTESTHPTMGKVSLTKPQDGLAGVKISSQQNTGKKTFTSSPVLSSEADIKGVFTKSLREIEKLKK